MKIIPQDTWLRGDDGCVAWNCVRVIHLEDGRVVYVPTSKSSPPNWIGSKDCPGKVLTPTERVELSRAMRRV